MTPEESITVTELLCNAFPGDRAWNVDEIRSYAKAIVHLDAEEATLAVMQAQASMERRPPVAAFISLYRNAKADKLARERGTIVDEPTGKRSLPVWVGRWTCARYFYAKFGKEQDMRRFPEQGEWADPTVPLMPLDEWVTEAKAIRGRDVYRVLGA